LLRTAVTLNTDPVTHATAAVELAPVLLVAGQIDEAVEVLERGLVAVENADAELARLVEAYLLLLGVCTAAVPARPAGSHSRASGRAGRSVRADADCFR
jgi:hypothetical protein